MPARISILGIPSDEQSSWRKGSAEGPQAIREAFNCESTNTFCEAGFDLKNHPAIRDEGDLRLASGERARQQIETTVAELLARDRRVLSLGGDHAITYPVLKAFAAKYPRLTVIQLDAHPDLYDELDGNRFSHACPFARSLEDGLLGHLLQIGIRTMNRQQQEQADRFGVEVIPMNAWSPELRYPLTGPVYLTVDLDVLDPAFAPGISHPEPGGFSTRDLLGLIQHLDIDLVGADIVELNPTRDRHAVTALTAAKIMKEVLARLLDV